MLGWQNSLNTCDNKKNFECIFIVILCNLMCRLEMKTSTLRMKTKGIISNTRGKDT